MTINPYKVEISFDSDTNGSSEILLNLTTLLTTPVGTVALDRDLGIDFSILDQPLLAAQNLYSMEISQKIERYESRVKVQNITYKSDVLNAAIIPKVVISYG